MTTQNIKPILFSTEMVQAILTGRKTQTRRVVKESMTADLLTYAASHGESLNDLVERYCKVKKGDILWARETWIKSEHASDLYYYKTDGGVSGKWKPSIHMPKEAARIFHKVTDVRAERLQDISEEDAIAEGIERYGPFGEFKGEPHPGGGMMRFRAYSKAARAFQDLWNSINGKKYPWKSNPWVWVYTFEQTKKPENF